MRALLATVSSAKTVVDGFVAGYNDGRNAEMRLMLVDELRRDAGLLAKLRGAGVVVPPDVVQAAAAVPDADSLAADWLLQVRTKASGVAASVAAAAAAREAPGGSSGASVPVAAADAGKRGGVAVVDDKAPLR